MWVCLSITFSVIARNAQSQLSQVDRFIPYYSSVDVHGMRCNVAHLSLLLPPIGAVAQQNCPSPHFEGLCIIAEINTTIHITGTVNTSFTIGTVTHHVDSVECFRDNGTTIDSDYSAGTILITYTVMEGTVEIFCNSTCGSIEEQGTSNIITITGEGDYKMIL